MNNNILEFRLFCKNYQLSFPDFEFEYSQDYLSLKKTCRCHVKWYGVNPISISSESCGSVEDSITSVLLLVNEFLTKQENCLAVIKLSR